MIHENLDISAGQKKRFKFPMIAADALSAEVDAVLNFFFQDTSERSATNSRASEIEEDRKTNDGGEKPQSESIDFAEPDPEDQPRSSLAQKPEAAASNPEEQKDTSQTKKEAAEAPQGDPEEELSPKGKKEEKTEAGVSSEQNQELKPNCSCESSGVF